MPAAIAVSFTWGTTSCMPRPRGRSGCVTASATSWPARRTAFKVGTANEGVPQKTSFIEGLPLAGLLYLANPAQDEIALEGAHATEEEDAVEVIDLVLESACEEFDALYLEPVTVDVLRANDYLCGAGYLLANLREAEAALFFILLAFAEDDLGIDENDLLFGALLEAEIDDGDAPGDTDLRSGEADALRCVHRLEHVVDELAQLIVELGDGLGGPFENRVGIFDDLQGHLLQYEPICAT